MAYTPEQKSAAKAVVLAYGNGAKATEALAALWGGDGVKTPSDATLSLWRRDPSIEPDPEFLDRFSDEVKRSIAGSVDRLLGPLEQRAQKEIASGKALDVLNVVKAWGITVDKVRPANNGALTLNLSDNRKNAYYTIAPSLEQEALPEAIEGEFTEE